MGTHCSLREKKLKKREMSYGKGDFGDASFPSQSTTAPANTGGATSTNMDYSRLTSVVASNTTKIGQNNKEINRLAGYIGTEQDGASIREQLQQKQQVTRRLCKDTERFFKRAKRLATARARFGEATATCHADQVGQYIFKLSKRVSTGATRIA